MQPNIEGIFPECVNTSRKKYTLYHQTNSEGLKRIRAEGFKPYNPKGGVHFALSPNKVSDKAYLITVEMVPDKLFDNTKLADDEIIKLYSICQHQEKGLYNKLREEKFDAIIAKTNSIFCESDRKGFTVLDPNKITVISYGLLLHQKLA